MTTSHPRSAAKEHLWELLFRYIGVIVFLIGAVLLLSSALLKERFHVTAEVLRDLGIAFIPIAIVAIVFEVLAKRQYIATLQEVVRDEFSATATSLAGSVVTRIVEDTLRLRRTVDVELLETIDTMKRAGLDRIMTRAELEVSDISFQNAVVKLAEEPNDKEFFIVGKSLGFVSRQLSTISAGLSTGVNFRFLLISPNRLPWDFADLNLRKQEAQRSIESLRRFLLKQNPSWRGTLELRKTTEAVEHSFSSFVAGGKRISVMNFNLGEEINSQWAQVFVHRPDATNFATHLHLLNENKYSNGQYVLGFPSKNLRVYVYGLKENAVIFVRKTDSQTWELPGGKVQDGELPEEAAVREFLEETGHQITIMNFVPSTEGETLAFIGRIGEQTQEIDTSEISEVRMFNVNDLPPPRELTYPNTGYDKVLRLENYLVGL